MRGNDEESRRAAEELALVDQTRARSVRAAQPPLWADALCAAMLAGVWALVMSSHWVAWIVAAALFIGGFALNARTTRRKGRLLDERATTTHMLRCVLFMAPLIFGALLLGRHRPLWVLMVFAVVAGGVMFVYLRSESCYQARRLAKADFEPSEMV